MVMYKFASIGSTIALIVIAIFATNKSSELDVVSSKNRELESKISILETENKGFKIANSILNDATSGLTKAKPETMKGVTKVVSFLNSGQAGNEPKFAECWDRKLKTTNWGSMGPWGLLDECIDAIEKKESAILLREIENAAEAVRSNCSYTALNAADGRERCGVDRDFRLLSAANRALFSALTTPEWLAKQKPVITE